MTILYAIGRSALFAGVFMVSIFAHEVGHMLAYRLILKKRPPIKFKFHGWKHGLLPTHEYVMGVPEDLPKNNFGAIVLVGVLTGFITIYLLSRSLLMGGIEALLLYLLYTAGSWHDIKILWGLAKTNGEV